MPVDLGDGVDLTWNPTNGDVGVATLTLTLPDASVLTPAVTHVGVGVYAPTTNPFVTTQVGRHLVEWVGTGTNAQAYQDVFDVLPADERLIISLDEARKSLRQLATQIDNDDLRGLIAAATPVMEDICGPIVPITFDEWHDGGSRDVRLLQAPVLSITSVLEAYGAGYTRTLSQQNLDSGAFDAFGYTPDLLDGVITRRTSGVASPFAHGHRNVHVVYVAGRKPIPANIIRATRRLVRWLWATEMQGQRPTGQAMDSLVITPAGFAVPRDVVQLCGAEARIPGIG